jgi:hypothetical protein
MEPALEGPLDGFVRVDVFRSRGEAEVARSALAARDIPATLLADDDGGVGGISLSLDHQAAELRVPQDRWEEARLALGLDVRPEPIRSRPPWWVVAAVGLVLVGFAAAIAVSIVG